MTTDQTHTNSEYEYLTKEYPYSFVGNLATLHAEMIRQGWFVICTDVNSGGIFVVYRREKSVGMN